MAENLRKLVHDYTSAEKDGYISKWPIVSYSTEDEHVNYIGGQKITYWVNVPSTGEYSIFGNRKNGNYYDTTQNYKVKVDGKKAIASSLTYTFNEVGEHKIIVKTKYDDLSLIKLKDETDSYTTIAPIKKIVFNHVDGNSVNSLMTVFQKCLSLTEIKGIDKLCTSNCSDLSYAFNQCNILTSVGDLSNWDTSKVTTMCQMFMFACELTSIGDLSKWDTSKVTNMQGMCYYCDALTNIGVPPIPKGCVTTAMFGKCSNLNTIENSGIISTSVMFDDSPLTRDSALILFNALDASNVGTLTLSTSTKALLSEDDIKIATDKGWTIA